MVFKSFLILRESKASCNGVEYSDIELKQGKTTETDPNRDSSLSFLNNMLVPKASYCFQVTVSKESLPEKIGIANIKIKVRDIPGGGCCFIESALTIESFAQDIRINCPGWTTDPKSTIRYEISARQERVTEWLILQSMDPSSVFQSVAAFNPGNYIAKSKSKTLWALRVLQSRLCYSL
jgi:hypothetical protein